MGPDDRPLGFGWGPLLDVVAPGSGMPTTAPVLRAGGFLLGASYQHLCCNSIASALVTGAAALVLEADPTLSPDQAEKRIKLSARKTPGIWWTAPAARCAGTHATATGWWTSTRR